MGEETIKGERVNTVKEIKEERDKAYKERNQFVIQKLKQYEKLGITVGWKIDQEQPESDWVIIYVLEQDHSFFGHIGQMGWHVNKNQLNPEKIDWLNPINQEYDGHSTEEKYQRMTELDRKIANQTYSLSETHLLSMVSNLSSARGGIESCARATRNWEDYDKEGQVDTLIESAEALGQVTDELLEVHEKQYRRHES